MKSTLFLQKKPYIIALLLMAFIPLSESVAEEKWGAIPLSEAYRPDRLWIKHFPSKPHVIANKSLADAIESCDSVVGEDNYCVIDVKQTATGLPLEIFRSKTKLIGTKDMLPLTTTHHGTFIYIGENTQQVIIEGLNLQGHSAGNNEISAIFIEGKNINNILIHNNKIHHFDSDNDAHGIAVYGSGKDEKDAIRHIIIEQNDIFDMRTGSSESIVVNGNVIQWEIKNNTIKNINNIAIDAIGGEGTSPTEEKQGRILPSATDAARYGFIEDNRVSNMSTAGNPAYDNEETWAAAIYIDGGHHIKIANNHVQDAAWAYMIGAENCVITHHITMEKNKAINSHYGDLYIGGYAKQGYQQHKTINCDPNTSKDDNEGHGYIENVTIKNNNLLSKNTSEKNITIEYRTTQAIITEPDVNAVNSMGNGLAKNDNNTIRIK
jgi:hypothetical protein